MKQIHITGPNFEQAVTLPETMRELPLNNYVAFLSEAQKPGNEVRQLCLAVSEFYAIDIETVEKLQFEDVQVLFKYAVDVVAKFTPGTKKDEDCTFTYKGEMYTIPRMLPPVLAGATEIPPTLQTIDAIEIQEVIRLNKAETENLLKKYNTDFEGIKDAAIDDYEAVGKAFDRRRDIIYSQNLRMVAILTRRNDEPLPVNDIEREKWITERAVHFKDIDAATALEIDFFLHGILIPYKKTLQTSGILLLQTFALLAAMQQQYKPKPVRIKGQSRTGKRYSGARDSGRLSRALSKGGGLRGKKRPQ